MLRPLLEAARPRQWVKNLFVAAPLVFSKNLDELSPALASAAAVAIFCGLSSAVYLWNDIIDLEKDRAHPRKRTRPIAAGRLSVRAAQAGALVLGIGSLHLAALITLDFAMAAAGYLLLNVAYSLYLKKIVYLDVMSIALGFLLRVVGGAFAIDVWVSPYLLICTGLLACFMGFGKRAHELAMAADHASAQRAVLSRYRPDILRLALWLTGTTTFISYVLYTRAEHTLAFFHTTRMIFTSPCAAYGLVRFGTLVTRPDSTDSPTDAILKDGPFIANFVLWTAAITLIIYFR